MKDMVGRIGAFGVVPEANVQESIRLQPAQARDAMIAMSWLGASEPAGTFLIWTDHVPGPSLVPTLIMQIQGDVKNSGGCKVVDWDYLEDAVDRKGMLATMDGSHGGGIYMLSLVLNFTILQQGAGSGGILLCPTPNPATIEVYAMDHDPRWPAEAYEADAEMFGGTFTVDVPDVKGWISTNEMAGHFIIKAAKAPPEDDWLGPKPVPAARRQELLAAQ